MNKLSLKACTKLIWNTLPQKRLFKSNYDFVLGPDGYAILFCANLKDFTLIVCACACEHMCMQGGGGGCTSQHVCGGQKRTCRN